MEETGYAREYTVRAAEVPVQVYIQRVIDRLKAERRLEFATLFPGTGGREALVGTFLAVLELVKRGYLVVSQEDRGYGTIAVEFQGPDTLTAEDLFRDDVTVVQGG
jgi:chromatin segregation and condensation protein Rec8/ScpA/Scc1 (kleisin family)